MRIVIASDFINVSPLQLSLIRAALVNFTSDAQHPAHGDGRTAYQKVCRQKTAFSLAEASAICIALCNGEGLAKDNDERMMYCQTLLERGMEHGMDAADIWFDPLFLVVKGMQEKQMEILEAIKMFSDMGLNSTGGLSNNSNGMPKHIRPIMDSAMVAMAMMQGLTSAIVNPNDKRLMETIKSCDVLKNNTLYADSYLEL